MNPNTRLLASLGICVALLLAVSTGCSTCSKFFGCGPSISLPRPHACCPSCGIPRADGCMCQPDYVCHGYNSTCWYDWPEECVDCNDVMSGRAATPEFAQPSAGADSTDSSVNESTKTILPPADVPPREPGAEDLKPDTDKPDADADPPASPPIEVKPDETSRLPIQPRPRREFGSFSTTQIIIEPVKPRPKANKTTIRTGLLPMVPPVMSEGREVFDLKPKNVNAHRLAILDRPGPLREVVKPSGRITWTTHLAAEIIILPTTDKDNDWKNSVEESILEISTNAETMPLTHAHFQQPSTSAEIFFVMPQEEKFETSLGTMFGAPPGDSSKHSGDKSNQSAGDFWAVFHSE